MAAVEASSELNVGLCYNEHTHRIIVSIVEARNLKTESLDNSSPGDYKTYSSTVTNIVTFDRNLYCNCNDREGLPV